jgi:hypothetical protein
MRLQRHTDLSGIGDVCGWDTEETYGRAQLRNSNCTVGFEQVPGSTARLAVGIDESEVQRINREIATSFVGLGLLPVINVNPRNYVGRYGTNC